MELPTEDIPAEAIPAIVAALAQLVSMDSANYQRDTMRYCGAFDAGRAALADAGLGAYPHPDAGRTNDPLIRALREIADADGVDASDLQTLARRALDTSTW